MGGPRLGSPVAEGPLQGAEGCVHEGPALVSGTASFHPGEAGGVQEPEVAVERVVVTQPAVRAHEVAETVDVIRMTAAIAGTAPPLNTIRGLA